MFLAGCDNVATLNLTINNSEVQIPQGSQADVSVGSISPADVMGLTGVSATSNVGAISPAAMTVGLTGQQATSQVGNLIVDHRGFLDTQAATSVGSIVTEIGVPLTGLQATSSVGAISPADVVGLTGLEAVSSVGNPAILAYQNVDITGNTSYSDVDITGNTSYTDVTHVA